MKPLNRSLAVCEPWELAASDIRPEHDRSMIKSHKSGLFVPPLQTEGRAKPTAVLDVVMKARLARLNG